MERKLAHERKVAKLESRRATKPIVEKRRRARINQYLVELKRLICQATNRDLSRSSKLEKADILEMTVAFLQNMQQRQLLTGISADPRGMGKFTGGFVECAGEVQRYLQATDCVEPHLRQRLVEHMQQCAVSLGTTTIAAAAAATASDAFNGNSLAASSIEQHHGAADLHGRPPQHQNDSLLLSPPSNNLFLNQFSSPTFPVQLPQQVSRDVDANSLPPHNMQFHPSQQELLNSLLAVGVQLNPSGLSLPRQNLLLHASPAASMGAFNVQRYYASLHGNANNSNGGGGAAAMPQNGDGGERDNYSSHSPSSSSTSSSLRSSSEASSHTSETEMSMMRPASSCRSSPHPRILAQFQQPHQRIFSGSHAVNQPPPANSNCNSSVWRPW